MVSGLILLALGIALVLWGADKFTDGAVGTAMRFRLSTFYVGAVVSGFEPENLVTGGAAALGSLPQIALGTVIGSAIFMLTAGLGLTLLLVPMEVRIPRQGSVAMIASLLVFAILLWNDGTVSRFEGFLLVVVPLGLMRSTLHTSPRTCRRCGSSDTRAVGACARATEDNELTGMSELSGHASRAGNMSVFGR